MTDTRIEDLLEEAAALANDVLAVNADEYDRDAVFPGKNFDALRSAGFLGLTIPSRFGGLGLRVSDYVDVLTTLAKGCASTASAFHMHNVAMWELDALGNDQQKEHYFGEVIEQGHLVGSWGAEPGTSWSGPVSLSTEYRAVDGGFELSGSKYFCSLGNGATYGLLYGVNADLERDATSEDIQLFLVDARSEEVTIDDTWDPIGMRATASNPVHLDGAFVPDIGRLGQPGDIRRFPAELYAVGYAAVQFGLCSRAYAAAVEYAGTRTLNPGNIPIRQFERIQRKIGRMALDLHAADLALVHATEVLDRREALSADAIMQSVLRARAITTESAISVTNLAIEVYGGRGAIRGSGVERYFRDARVGVLMVPAFDQCLETIAKGELGLDAATVS